MARRGLSYRILLAGFSIGMCLVFAACTTASSDENIDDSSAPVDIPSVPDSSDPPDEPCVNTFTLQDTVPALLSETGLYENIADKSVHELVKAFTPRFQLWSDGAEKARWVYLPECNPVIDTQDMNDWSLPVGTRLFKEFAVGGVRVETRLIERFGSGPRDFRYATYLWRDDEQEAELVSPEGLANAKGTAHDVPSLVACRRCHGDYAYGGGRPSRALGFGAMQLNHADAGFTLSEAAEQGYLSTQPPEFALPGDTAAQEALGYLHVNCGVCHNASADGLPQADMNLWWDIEASTLEATGAYQTAVGQPARIFNDQHVSGRVVAGDASSSAVYYRMSQRGNNAQMPPVASEVVDTEGLAIIRTWIEGLE